MVPQSAVSASMLPAPKGGSRSAVRFGASDGEGASMLPAPKGGSRNPLDTGEVTAKDCFNAARPEGRESDRRGRG